MDSATVTDRIKQQILSKLDPAANIKIIDETYKHTKHKGYVDGKFHFVLEIVSKKLASKPKILSHKEIYKSLDSLMQYIHALSIKIRPE